MIKIVTHDNIKGILTTRENILNTDKGIKDGETVGDYGLDKNTWDENFDYQYNKDGYLGLKIMNPIQSIINNNIKIDEKVKIDLDQPINIKSNEIRSTFITTLDFDVSNCLLCFVLTSNPDTNLETPKHNEYVINAIVNNQGYYVFDNGEFKETVGFKFDKGNLYCNVQSFRDLWVRKIIII